MLFSLGLLTSVSVEYDDSPCLLLGANVTLRCYQNGVPRATVQWTKGSIQLTNGDRFLISKGDELTLTVFNVEESDNGEYTCTGNNTLRSGRTSRMFGSLIVSRVCGKQNNYVCQSIITYSTYTYNTHYNTYCIYCILSFVLC